MLTDGAEACTQKCRLIIGQLIDFKELMESMRARFQAPNTQRVLQRLNHGVRPVSIWLGCVRVLTVLAAGAVVE
jgi:hypothetical protein